MMRACFFRYGLVIVFSLNCIQTVPAEDTFGAGRKMQGSTQYSSTRSPFDSARQVEPMAAPFSPSMPQAVPQQEAATSSVMKQPASANNNVQQIFPTASTTPAAPTVVAAPAPANSAPPAASGGLKSLQQRFSNMRKLSGSKPATGSNTPPARETEMPLVEAPAVEAKVVTPAPTPTPSPTTTAGPSVGSPVPPTMPDIRTAQRFSPAPAANAGRGDTVVPTPVEPRAAAATTTPRGTATVGGPVASSRRMPTGQAAGLAREDRSPTVSPTVERAARESEAKTSVVAGEPSAKPVRAAVANGKSNVLFTRQSPILGVETVGPRSITIGKEATYTVTVANSGDAAAQDVKVSVRIPPWTEVVGTTATNGSAEAAADAANESLAWNISRLEANTKEELSLRLVPRESRPFDLAVQCTCSPIVSQAMVEVKEPKLAMSVTGPEEILFGDSKVYKMSISNPGTGEAENVVLFLSPVDGAERSPTRHEIGNIAAGENKLVEVELTARQTGKLAIKGAATADGNLRSETAQEILVRRAGLKVATEGPETKFAGTVATFNIVVTNPGNATAEGIQLAALLPAGAKYVSSSGGHYVAEQNKVIWTAPSLRSGGEQDFDLKCVLNSPGANRLQVVALAASDLSDSAALNTNVEALADLKLEVSDPTGPMAVGEDVVYEVRIRNRGTKAAENVAVNGFFSGGIEPLSAQGGQYQMAAGQVTFKPVSAIAPGGEVVLKIQARAEQPGNHIFRAEVNCASVGMKLAAEETTLFYGETNGRSARVATKPQEVPTSAQPPAESTEKDGGATLVR
jgi:uncharacterized repeat protein (TIGR01451 family)